MTTTDTATLRAALLEACDHWEELWTSDNNEPPPERIAELRTLATEAAAPVPLVGEPAGAQVDSGLLHRVCRRNMMRPVRLLSVLKELGIAVEVTP